MGPESQDWCKRLVFIAIVFCAFSAVIDSNEMETTGSGVVTAYVAGMRVSIESTTLPRSKMFDTTLTCTVTPLNISDPIPASDGANWRLGIFGSDKWGNRKKEVTQILPRRQRGLAMYPGQDLTFEFTKRLNLKGIGSGTNYPYLCIELSKDDNNEDFVFHQGSFVSCVKFTPPGSDAAGGGESGGLQIHTYGFSVETITDRISPGLTRIRISMTTAIKNDTDLVPDAQFRLGVFGSGKKNGRGPRMNEIRQILAPEDTTYPVYAGQVLEIVAETELDLEVAGSGETFPFICVELDKRSDDVNFDIPSLPATGTLISCLLSGSPVNPPEDDPVHPHEDEPVHPPADDPMISRTVPQMDARVDLTRLAVRIVRDTTLLDVQLTYQVVPTRDSDPIPASDTANWRLSLYGSRGPNTDERFKEVTQLLSPEQQRLPMYPGERVTFDVTRYGLDLTGIGTGTDYPFVCVEFGKAYTNWNFAFPTSYTCCSRVTNIDAFDYINNYVYPTADPGPDDGPREPFVEVFLDEDDKVYEKATTPLLIDLVVSEYSSPFPMYGSALWILKVWASGKKDGSGPRLGESTRTLDGRPLSGDVPRKVPFNDRLIRLDLTGVKCKAVKYLCAEISLILGPRVTGCTKLKCKKPSRSTRGVRSIEPALTTSTDNDWEEVMNLGTAVEVDTSKSKTLSGGYTFHTERARRQ